MKFTKDQIWYMLEDMDTKVIDIDSTWRHGTRETFVSMFEGKYYRYTLERHHSEGIEIYGDYVEATEVEQVEVVTTEWRAVKNG